MSKISINTQSSIKIEDNKIFYFDPYKVEEELHDADYIFITHDHYDHLDVDSINKIKNDNTMLIVPDSIITKIFPLGFNMKNVRGVLPNQEYTIDNIHFSTIPSYNTNKSFHPKNKNYVGYIIDLDKKILISGDSDITDELTNVKCDIAFIPIGGTYTMDYQEAADVINIIKPEKVIPTHYGSIVGEIEDGQRFKELIDKDIEVELLIK